MSKYLITGGAGFIGSHLAAGLVSRGDRVRVLDDLSSGKLSNLDPLEVGEVGSGAPVEFMQASITDASACARAMDGVEGVLHEAAQVSVPVSVAQPIHSYAVNVTGTQNLLEEARKQGVQRFVFAASSAAYGESEELPKREDMPPQPCSPYASGKVAGEHLLQVYAHCFGMQTVSLRYFNVFGPRQADDSPYTGVIAIFARALIEGRPVTIFGDGEQSRDFTYIDNVVAANLTALDLEGVGREGPIDVGTGEQITLNQLHSAIATALGVESSPQYADPRPGDVRHSQAALDRARRLLNYNPMVDWRVGLERTLSWYKQALESSGESH